MPLEILLILLLMGLVLLIFGYFIQNKSEEKKERENDKDSGKEVKNDARIKEIHPQVWEKAGQTSQASTPETIHPLGFSEAIPTQRIPEVLVNLGEILPGLRQEKPSVFQTIHEALKGSIGGVLLLTLLIGSLALLAVILKLALSLVENVWSR